MTMCEHAQMTLKSAPRRSNRCLPCPTSAGAAGEGGAGEDPQRGAGVRDLGRGQDQPRPGAPELSSTLGKNHEKS